MSLYKPRLQAGVGTKEGIDVRQTRDHEKYQKGEHDEIPRSLVQSITSCFSNQKISITSPMHGFSWNVARCCLSSQREMRDTSRIEQR